MGLEVTTEADLLNCGLKDIVFLDIGCCGFEGCLDGTCGFEGCLDGTGLLIGLDDNVLAVVIEEGTIFEDDLLADVTCILNGVIEPGLDAFTLPLLACLEVTGVAEVVLYAGLVG